MKTCKDCQYFDNSQLPVDCIEVQQRHPDYCEAMRKLKGGKWSFNKHRCPHNFSIHWPTAGVCKHCTHERKECPNCGELIRSRKDTSAEFVLSCRPMATCFDESEM